MSIDLESIRQIWPELIKKVGAKLGMRLCAVEPLAIDGNTLKIGSKPGYSTLADPCADPENVERISFVLGRMLRTSVAVEYVPESVVATVQEETRGSTDVAIVVPADDVQGASVEHRCNTDPRWRNLVDRVLACLSGPAGSGAAASVAACWLLKESLEMVKESGSPLELVDLASCDYGIYLKTKHWQETRELALARWESRCCVCNSTDGLDVHHRTYERRGNEAISDLVVLCRTCHRLFHDNGRLAKPGR